MTVKSFVIFVVCIVLVGCGRRSEETAKPPATATAAVPDTHKEDANTVEVDEAMLRDLRITTRPVE
jgi:hypothetical protein